MLRWSDRGGGPRVVLSRVRGCAERGGKGGREGLGLGFWGFGDGKGGKGGKF